MDIFSLLLSMLAVSGVLCQDTHVEAGNFSVEDALASAGVHIDCLPQAVTLTVRRSEKPSGCAAACSILSYLYDENVLHQNSTAYKQREAAFWSQQQADVHPYCIFQPAESKEVAITVLLSRLTQCPFAVKSGGHAAFAGASNIQGGITVDLKLMNQIELSDDKTVAKVGPGNTWLDVYSRLERDNVTVIGGRGISFFSGLHGWACDNVENYELVTAAGAIINVSQRTHPDLYWALRGGGPNFGIVTRFDYITYPQGLMWGGPLTYDINASQSLLSAYTSLGHSAPADPSAAIILSFAHFDSQWLASLSLEYADPTPHPAIFAPFYNTTPAPLADGTAITTLTNLTLALAASNPHGLRQTFWTSTYKLDAALARAILAIWLSELAPLARANLPHLLPALTFQLITAPMLRAMRRRGGNCLGLDPDAGPYMLLNPSAMWGRAADDGAVMRANREAVRRCDDVARAMGLAVPYRYMNYASREQGVVEGYGEANVERLGRVAGRWDPSGVFQRLQPGYFKLGGVSVDGGD
ncbi:FAD-binding domain-containing protein [Saccharata proteae CBS 121410]|uniref:FAD-binding domain-containing protein n=1 Tax=Saccharata proteae CBS 121410 TaxID=1314787 RepID=A0A9P4M045_9PEZI|nr:FAD-binding domain-containing protein [Saccharata proteae CBS 121410]